MRYLVAVLCLAACAPEDAPDARDYTDSACPPPPPRWSRDQTAVCDRGRAAMPRYVAMETCAAELGRDAPGTIASTHPNGVRCVLPYIVVTLDDVRRAP